MRAPILFALLLVACGATNEGARFDVAPTAAKADNSPLRASSPEVGVIVLISDAISELSLDPAQNSQLNALISDIKHNHGRLLDMRTVLALDMSRSVQARAIDEKVLLLDAENLGKARADVAVADNKSLEELHRLLTPAQRKQFAAGLVAKADKLPTDDFVARYATWRTDLEITPDQDMKISPKLDADKASAESARVERESWRQRLKATAADFEKDQFTAASYADPDVVGTTTVRVQRVIAFLKLVVPELTQKQLDRAAETIRGEAGITDRADRE